MNPTGYTPQLQYRVFKDEKHMTDVNFLFWQAL